VTAANSATTDRLQRITAFLEGAPEVVFALLFGSRAAGTARPDSDHDVAVWLSQDLDDGQRHEWLRHAYASLTPPDDLDLVVLNEAPALLGHRALMGRILLMRDRAAYSRYFVRTLALSNDEAYWRDLHDRARRRRLEEGRFGRP
jgi:predicted nucleotidyltransferase